MQTIIRVDMDNLAVRQEPLSEGYQAFGGRGLIAQVLLDEVNPACDPLGASNKLIVAPGLLGGTPVSSAGRLSVGAKSPLTGGIKESNAGGVLGHKLARLDIHGIIVEGTPKTDRMYLLFLSKDRAELQLADELKGLGCYAVAERLRSRYGEDIGLAIIGPIAELGGAIAGVAITDIEGRPSRYAARGGLGAVMAVKGLKAIIVDDRGGHSPSLADREAFRQLNRELARLLRENPITGESYPKYGTAGVLSLVNERGGLPTRNFSQGRFEQMEQICGETLHDLILQRDGEGLTTHGCMPGCIIRCSNVVPDGDGKESISPLEFETLGMLGSNCGIGDIDAIAELNYICNDLGIDTIETGATIGLAMEAGVSRFGDVQGAKWLLEEIRKGTTLGLVLRQGAAVTAKVFGVKRIPVVKGQAMAAYDPRTIKGNAVTYATSPMGADHTAGNTIRLRWEGLTATEIVAMSRKAQIAAAAYDSLGLCVFVGPVLSSRPELTMGLFKARYGLEVGPDYFTDLGKQVLRMEKEFNRQAGLTADGLPEIFTSEPLPPLNVVFDIPPEELAKTLAFTES
ncbi:MAG: aldehyde ferredoxin oxidoreductase [Chloroflexi bacterium]|nr:aldehyde ferredoxin oxidoreductase [Chloroflexota bacterium]